MYNQEIRKVAKAKGVLLCEIAEALGIQDSGFSRKLRRELPEKEKTKILALIDEIAESRKKGE